MFGHIIKIGVEKQHFNDKRQWLVCPFSSMRQGHEINDIHKFHYLVFQNSDTDSMAVSPIFSEIAGIFRMEFSLVIFKLLNVMHATICIFFIFF